MAWAYKLMSVIPILVAIDLFGFVNSELIIIGYLLGLSLCSLFLKLIDRKFKIINFIDCYAKTFLDYPYSEKYGENTLKPKSEKFGITNNEFNEYNSRFQLGDSIYFFIAVQMIGMICFLTEENQTDLVNFVIIFAISFLIHFLSKQIDKRISKKHPHFHKIKPFQDAMKIYRKVQEENRKKNNQHIQ
tara:strand:- start:102 stop:665 length:564 start_codon:yes stop_codon:yes gene_type:complete